MNWLGRRYLASHAAVDLLDLQRSLQLLQARTSAAAFKMQLPISRRVRYLRLRRLTALAAQFVEKNVQL